MLLLTSDYAYIKWLGKGKHIGLRIHDSCRVACNFELLTLVPYSTLPMSVRDPVRRLLGVQGCAMSSSKFKSLATSQQKKRATSSTR